MVHIGHLLFTACPKHDLGEIGEIEMTMTDNTEMPNDEGGELSEIHQEILAIQTRQLAQKARELRFIATHVEKLISAMYEKAEESRIGYAERDAYNLWRGSNIDFSMKATNHPNEVFHTVEKEVAEEINVYTGRKTGGDE